MLHVLKETGTAVLLVTHDSEEAMFMSDYIYVMRKGRLSRAAGDDLYCRPGSAFVAEFFGEVNRIDGPIVNNRMISPLGGLICRTRMMMVQKSVARHPARSTDHRQW